MKDSSPLVNNSLGLTLDGSVDVSSSKAPNTQSHTDENLIKYGSIEDAAKITEEVTQSQASRGIIDMFLSCLAFAIEHLVIKFLIKAGHQASQILLFRSVTTTIGITAYAYHTRAQGGAFGPKEDRYWLNFNGVFGAISIVTFFISMQHLDLGDTLALSFVTPVIMPIISYIWVGEDYTLIDAGATLIATIGVTFISKPEFLFGSDNPNGGSSLKGVVYAFIGAITGGLANISIRKISSNSTSIHTVNFVMIWILPICLGIIAYQPELFILDISYVQMVQYCAVVLTSFLGQYWLGRSLLTTPARFVSPIIFTKVFYAYINQYVFLGIPPTISSTVGVILVACSLILLQFEVQS
jgi:drug/metabolite transporter (DMT)-like permease